MVQLSPQIAPAITAIWFTSHRKLLRLSPQIGSAITANWFGYHRKMVQLLPHNGSTLTANCFGYHRKKKTIIIRVCTHEYINTQTHKHTYICTHTCTRIKKTYIWARHTDLMERRIVILSSYVSLQLMNEEQMERKIR